MRTVFPYVRDTQVNTILENQMGENFLGSFHVDEVSNLFVGKKTAGFLFSIMPSESISEMKMGHLIAVYIQESDVSMWFDTSGEHPYLKTHLDFLRKNSSASYFASKATQSDFVNKVCGQYSVSFLL